MADAPNEPDPLTPQSTAPDTPLQSSWPDKPAGEPPKKAGPLAFFRELPVLILIAFGLALLIKTFLVQAFYIPSESMVPTLLVGDRVLVNKLIYRFRDPHRGEIVVFVAEPDQVKRNALQRFFKSLTEGLGARTPPERDFIKRVIGLPGDTITMKDGVVTIKPKEGKSFTLQEPYLNKSAPDSSPFGPFTVPKDRFFLMGDNRANSSDSRVNTFGGLCPASPCAVPKSRIVGRAFITIWPPGRFSLHHRPSYAALFGGAGAGSWWERLALGFSF
jgi:signal peptidase I